MVFYLGTHHPDWLGKLNVPLCVSRRRLTGRKAFPRAKSPWVLDSGAFSELRLHGGWSIGVRGYIDEVRRIAECVGQMVWASQQDWMCEPFMIARTGLTVGEHQKRTVDNYAELVTLAPEIPWLPVLQGWLPEEYLLHREMFGCLIKETAGVGSVCRRAGDTEIQSVIGTLAQDLRLHGFGVKSTALRSLRSTLASADSMAWSIAARYQPPLPGCTHKNCANCYHYALRWRDTIVQD